MFKAGPLYTANLNATEELVINQGGTSSGKTYSILQALVSIAISQPKLVITVVGQDIPNLKVGALRDIENIINDSEELKQLLKTYNRTDRRFEWHSGSVIEFMSYDDGQDAKSGKRDISFFNEINGIPKPIFDEVHLRTRIRTYVDYNPNEEFYIHDYIGQPNVKFIRSWHEHNPFLPQSLRDKIEALKNTDEESWRVYARGLTGKIEGLIFKNWDKCDRIPDGAKLIAYGMDFGFTNDPTTLIGVYKQGGELWLNEMLYERGLTNTDISNKLSGFGLRRQDELICDSAEPKTIEELYRLGWNTFPAMKGEDSIRSSIDILKRYKLNVTSNSVNLIKELKSYKWASDRLGELTHKPVDFMNHGIDAIRYVALNKLSEDTGRYMIM